MAKLAALFVLGILLFSPSSASAADFKVNFTVIRQADGATLGELWYNDQVLWRLRLTGDGAQPASTAAPRRTTVVVPDLDSGLFLLKVYHQ